MMAEPRPRWAVTPGLDKGHPDGFPVMKAAWRLEPGTEAYERTEGTRKAANEAAEVVACAFSSCPCPCHGSTS